MGEPLLARRKLLKLLGMSSAGISTAAVIAISREKIGDSSEYAKEEIKRLKASYEELDARSQLILRLILAVSGLDGLIAL